MMGWCRSTAYTVSPHDVQTETAARTGIAEQDRGRRSSDTREGNARARRDRSRAEKGAREIMAESSGAVAVYDAGSSARREAKHLGTVDDSTCIEELTGTSLPIKKVFTLIDRVAETDATVLISGETGTGKELAARTLHRRSRRRGMPMVTVNCAAVPTSLLESELFGHVRGAFTDARADRKGLFVQADHGTLFLDEVGDMPLEMQAKLLRAIEVRAVRPLGARDEIPFDLRLIAATHRDLVARIRAGAFREDLYYRLHVVNLTMPPLRARGTDVLVLAQGFVEQFARQHERRVRRISSAVAGRLLAHSWPGNVRELRNCIERAVALARSDTLLVDDLPEQIPECPPPVLGATSEPSELVTLDEHQRQYIGRVIEAVNGNKRRAAQILGLDRTTLYRMIKRWSRSHHD